MCTRRKHIYKFSSKRPNGECATKNEMCDSLLYQRSWQFHLQRKQNQFSVLITHKHNVSLSARAEHTYRYTATCQPCPSVMLNHLGIPILVASLVDLNSGHWQYNRQYVSYYVTVILTRNMETHSFAIMNSAKNVKWKWSQSDTQKPTVLLI